MVLSVQAGGGGAPRPAAAISSSSQERRTQVDVVDMMGIKRGEVVDMVHSDPDITPSAGRRERPSTGTGSPIRLLVLGSHGVGKSAITVRYLTRRFIGEYRSQVDIIYRQTVQLDGLIVDLEIIDISTQPGDETLPTLEICQCDCYLVVYSVADKGTFISANQLLSAILKLRPQFPHPPITLLGNKQDLEHSREVSVDESSHAAQVFGCAFKEVSVAETSEDIVPVFSSLIRRTQALRRIQLPQKWPGTPSSTRQVVFSSASHCNCPSCGNCASDTQKNRSGRCSSLRLDIQAANSRRDRVNGVVNNSTGLIQNKCIKSPNIGKLETNVVKYQLAKSEVKRSVTKSFSSSLPRNLVQKSKEPKIGHKEKSVQDVNLNFKLNKSKLSRRTSANVRIHGNASCNNVKLNNKNKTVIQPTISSDTDQSDQECSSHGPVCRSFSSPECNCLLLRENMCNQNSKCVNHTSKTNKTDNLLTSIRLAEPGSLLSRGRSFIVDSGSRFSEQQQPECSCQIPNRHGSFKSSGKLEIVTVQNSKTNSLKSNACKNLGNEPYRESSLPYSYRSHSPKPKSKLNCNVSENLGFKPLQQSPHTRSLRMLKPLNSDSPESSSCTSPEESCSPTPRQRKFSVFGNFRALGNLLSNGSMPDLPSAKANISDRFVSIKKVFKKRSV